MPSLQYVLRRAAASKPSLLKLCDAIKLNVGLVFTDCEPKKIREILEKNKVVAGAKAGMRTHTSRCTSACTRTHIVVYILYDLHILI